MRPVIQNTILVNCVDDQTLARPLRKWVILWLAWIVGIAVWGLYLAMIFILLYRLFASG